MIVCFPLRAKLSKHHAGKILSCSDVHIPVFIKAPFWQFSFHTYWQLVWFYWIGVYPGCWYIALLLHRRSRWNDHPVAGSAMRNLLRILFKFVIVTVQVILGDVTGRMAISGLKVLYHPIENCHPTTYKGLGPRHLFGKMNHRCFPPVHNPDRPFADMPGQAVVVVLPLLPVMGNDPTFPLKRCQFNLTDNRDPFFIFYNRSFIRYAGTFHHLPSAFSIISSVWPSSKGILQHFNLRYDTHVLQRACCRQEHIISLFLRQQSGTYTTLAPPSMTNFTYSTSPCRRSYGTWFFISISFQCQLHHKSDYKKP